MSVFAQSLWKPVFHTTQTQWADSIFSTLSEEERIAQLFMVAAYSNKDEKHKEEISNLVDDKSSDLSKKSIHDLEVLLNEAIQKEDYERASLIRDEINKRQAN